MMRKPRRFCGHIHYRGVQFPVKVFTTSAKRCAELLDTTPHHIKTYFSNMSDMGDVAPDSIIAYIDGGEMAVAHPELRRKEMPLDEMKSLIDKHREKFSTYYELTKHLENQNPQT